MLHDDRWCFVVGLETALTGASEGPVYYIPFLAALVADQVHGKKKISWLSVHVSKCVSVICMSVHISRVYTIKEIVCFDSIIPSRG